MSLELRDDFTGTGALSASWGQGFDGTDVLVLAGDGTAKSGVTGGNYSASTWQTPTNSTTDDDVAVTLTALPTTTGRSIFLYMRVDQPTNQAGADWYVLWITKEATPTFAWYIKKYVNGAFSADIATGSGNNLVAGNAVRLNGAGGALSFYVYSESSWQLQGGGTDASPLPAGYLMIETDDDVVRFDDFTGGPMAIGGTMPSISGLTDGGILRSLVRGGLIGG